MEAKYVIDVVGCPSMVAVVIFENIVFETWVGFVLHKLVPSWVGFVLHTLVPSFYNAPKEALGSCSLLCKEALLGGFCSIL